MSADIDLLCSEKLTDHVTLVQVSGALEDEPDEEDYDEDIKKCW